MASPVITLNSSGITSLTQLGWQWIMPNGVQGQSVQATRNDGTIPSPSGSLVGSVLTQTYTWGTATWTYDTSTDSQLAITCAIHNTDANPITSVKFGSLQIQFQGSSNSTFVGATGTGKDIWTASDPCILPMVWNGGSGAGQLTYSCASQSSYSIDLNVSSAYFWGYTFSGKIAEQINSGATATFTFYLRWMLTTDDPITKNSDITSSFSTAYPIQFHTNDVRPIGTLFLSGTNNIQPDNLRGWVANDKGRTIANDSTTGAALTTGGNFAYTLSYMSNRALSGLSTMGAQGIIVWDIEGHQYSQGTSYIGMPQQLSNLAPEMDAAADAFFAQFTSLGYKVGITLRADALTASTPGYGPSSHAVQAPYTTETQAASDLLAKAEYAYNRWGCTLFYVDSFGIGIPGSPYDAGVVWQSLVQQMQAASLPFCMFSSEFSVTRSHQYGAPFHQMKNSNFVLPGEASMAAYPKLQVVNDISDAAITNGHFNLESTLVSAMLSGNLIPMFRSWFQDASFKALQSAIAVAEPQGWTGFLYMPPPPSYVQSPLIKTNSNAGQTSIASNSFASANTAGNCILVFVFCSVSGGTDLSVTMPPTDLAGNRYKLCGRIPLGSPNLSNGYLFACMNINAYSGNNIVTVPFAIAQHFAAVAVVEYTGAVYMDTSSGRLLNTTTSIDAGPTTTKFANETLVSFMRVIAAGTVTTVGGATIRQTDAGYNLSFADWQIATAGSNTFSWTVPSGEAMVITVALSPTAPTPNGLALVPPMGWDSWRLYGVGASATETNMHAQANALVSTGLSALGYTHFNVNDVLYNSRSGGNLVANSVKFPSGDTALWTFIKSKGLTPAYYLAPGTTGCNSFPGSDGNEATDAALIVTQGADYLMYDNCTAFGNSDACETKYATMQAALTATGHNIMMLASSPTYSATWNGAGEAVWASSIGADLRIVSPDQLTPTTWAKLVTYINYGVTMCPWSQPGSLNMPSEYLPTGNGQLTVAEGRSAMALWCVMAYPLWISADLTTISAGDLTTLSNTELIAINQDSLCDGGWLVSRTPAGAAVVDVWVKKMSGGQWAVVLFNQDASSQNITVNWSMFNQTGPYAVRDVIAHSNLGVMNTGYTTTVASHDSAVIQLSSPFGGVSFGSATSSECVAVWQALHRLLKIYGGNAWSTNPLQSDIIQMMSDAQTQYSALNNGAVITPADNP